MKIRAEVKKEFPKDKVLAELHEIRLRIFEQKQLRKLASEKRVKNQRTTAVPPT